MNGHLIRWLRVISPGRVARRWWWVGAAGLLVGLSLGLLGPGVAPAYADDPSFDQRHRFGPGDDDTRSVAVGDVNGDGALDLVVGNAGGQNAVYLNDGAGGFYSGVMNCDEASVRCFGPGDDGTSSVAVGDVNGDGMLDLVVGNDGQNAVYLNDGAGNFGTARDFGPGDDDTFSVAVGDVNGDGALDLVVGNSGTGRQNAVYLNDGAGGFYSGAMNCDEPGVRCFGPGDDRTYSVALADVNGDGDLDLVVGNDGQNVVHLNDGAGGFGAARDFGPGDGRTFSVALGDVNGDGALDLVAGDFWGQNAVYLNDGAGGFYSGATNCDETSVRCFGPGNDRTYSVALGDVNGDGALDLAVGDYELQNTVYLNDGAGDFRTARGFGPGDDDTWSVALGDVNGDGALDLVVGNTGEQNAVYLNDGAGDFSTARDFGPGDDRTYSVAVGDVNGDGALDLVVGNYTLQNAVYLNDGAGGFGAARGFGPSDDRTYSVAVGDVNGDGALDLIVGNSGQNAVYRNDGAGDFRAARGFGPGDDDTRSVALGDVNGDGALDLVVGNIWEQNAVYLNDGAGGFYSGAMNCDETSVRCFGPGNDRTYSVALGDVNGDGALDLVVGNDMLQNAVYLNDGAANFRAGMVDGTDPPPGVRYFGPGDDDTLSVAVGDVNGDGTLDLVVGNIWEQNAVYLNDGAGDFGVSRDLGPGDDHTYSVAVGDVNGDGALDLVVGNYDEQNAVYLNRSRLPERLANNPPSVVLTRPGSTTDANFYSTAEILAEPIIPITYTLFDPDGDRVGRIAAYYSPDGGGRWLPAIGTSATVTTGLSPGTYLYHWDVFKSGYFGQSDNVVLRLEAYPQPARAGTAGTYRYRNNTAGPYQSPYAAATTFPFRVRGTQVRVYSETVTAGNEVVGALVYHLPQNQTTGAEPLADRSGTPFRTDQYGYLPGRGTIGISDTLFALLPVSTSVAYAGALAFDGVDDYVEIQDPFENDTAFTISLWVRPALIDDGRYHGFIGKQGDWRRKPGMWLAPTQGGLHYDSYDLSGIRYYGVLADFFLSAGEWVHVAWVKQGTAYRIYRNGVLFATRPAPERFFTTDTSYWIGRVDSFWPGLIDEVRIWSVARSQAEIRADMYRRLAWDEPGLVGYWPFNDPDIPSSGWCRDQTANGNDGMVHGPTWTGGSLGGYTLYHTSATPTPTGLAGYTVQKPGVQALAVTADHPLILFDLNVSLEWDARQDTAFVEQLRFDLKRASEILFDATNGQAALGEIVVYHDRQRWLDADLRIYATNAMRPNAGIGGIRTGVYTEVVSINPYAVTTLPYTLTYKAGRVRMGSLWNRFGEASGTLGEDWPRALAHELGHYLFYLYDNYIGLDENGIIGPAVGCFGSLMTNPYLEDYSEFHPAARWGEQCARTLSAQRSGRADWETIVRFYPWLDGTNTNNGPSALPLAVTRIRESEIAAPPTTLDLPIFYLTAEGASYQPGGSAQAILFQGQRLIDLGRPSLDKVRAWGARPGDRLCVYEPEAVRLGCEEIEAGDNQLALVEREDWRPEVIVTPVTSRTVAVSVAVAGLPNATLQGRLYPVNASASVVVTLTPSSNVTVYTATFSQSLPSGQGYIQLWVDEGESEQHPRRETVTHYALGGNPGLEDIGFGLEDIGFGLEDIGFGLEDIGFGLEDIGFGLEDIGFSPAVSIDGQVILYGDVEFAVGQFYALQKATSIPDPLPWATLVGDGYWLMASPDAPDFAGTSLNFRYLGQEVPPGEERFLSLYYWDGGGWEKLPTRLNLEYNEASAPTQGPGLYALMSSLEIPLYQTGWNLFAYPVAGTRPVAEALRSIEGYYNTVYGYAVADTADPWKVYGWGVPDWVNDLQTLRFGQGYWINVTEPITLQLRGSSTTGVANASSLPVPPATYYGAVSSAGGLASTAEMQVTAWIDDHRCGQARTQEVDGGIWFAIDVLADDTRAGCGAPGRGIVFEVESLGNLYTATWNNDRVWRLPVQHLFLPLVLKRY